MGAGSEDPDRRFQAAQHAGCPPSMTWQGMVQMKIPTEKIDVTLVAGRRPELLRRTLESFEANLFANCRIDKFYCNIDPFGGDDQDHIECKRILMNIVPDAIVFEPRLASYGAAVKRLWQHTSSNYVFHFEDDWLIHEPLAQDDILPLFDHKTRMISLMCKTKYWNARSQFHYARRRFPIIGKLPFVITILPFVPGKLIDDEDHPLFTFSPSFLEGNFARVCARLIKPEINTEKQFYNGTNRVLEEYVSQYRNRFYFGRHSPNIIEDIGREWRASKGIKKNIIDGRAVWTKDAN